MIAINLVNGGIISHAALKRARKQLCGQADCCCGDWRGPQDFQIETCWDYDGEYAKVYEL